MKNYLIVLVFLSPLVYGQNIQLNLFCYKPGDTLSLEVLNKTTVIEVHNMDDGSQKMKLVKWSLTFSSSGQIKSYKSNPNSGYLLYPEIKTELIKDLKKNSKKMIFDDIVVSYPDGRIASLKSVVFYVSRVGGKCSGSNGIAKDIAYKGKLLTGNNTKEPLVNQKVILKDNKDFEVQATTTDKYGDFTFQSIDAKNSYKVEVVSGPKIKDDQMFIAKQDGSDIRSLKKVGNNFVYELLPIELTKLSEEKIDDTEMTLKNFSGSSKNELTVTKDVYYKVNSSEITPESKLILDGIISSMKNNKSLKLSIISHTDSQGDDVANMNLSEKRARNVMDYFLSKGIQKENLTSKGLGETKIINRCKNNVDCSEEEHKLNRRTEFIFSK
ncbi:MAG: OmpA/MotB domain protein [Bacteroidetes bacterium]|jgi:outer membrane protein OmpA-like peptidoglycan-associated protein|nr:OmpA/MotB domain protein [Bacteroidota bacterium]MDF2452944.1 OmpA/MotB domain protein [Bacteroidota bacterium]